MTTRHAQSSDTFNQERYCSSPELQRGLMANLVAKRCSVISEAKDRELIWFVQMLSHAEGGLAKLAKELRTLFPERFSTRSMQKFGMKSGQIYSAEQVRAVRKEIDYDESNNPFPIKGDERYLTIAKDELAMQWWKETGGDLDQARQLRERVAQLEKADKCPDNYSASVFVGYCTNAAVSELEKDIATICLSPDVNLETVSLWYFPSLVNSLRDYMRQWIEKQSAGRVVTQLGQTVFDTLNYCLATNRMALLDGHARTGKSFSAKAWCDLHPGQTRYVQVPSSSDDIGFFRAIAKSLGVSINLNSKAQQLRDRVEEVLQHGDLILVLDEAHYLWPQSNYREALPARVNWVMTALVNHNVAVALITTPQFLRTQKRIEERTSWTSEQFIGRIGHYEKLPDSLSAKDLSLVAKSLLPEGDEKTIELLTVYAQSSAKYLAGIDAVICRSKYLAQEDGRSRVLGSDVKRAIKESVIPSDSALAQAMEMPAKGNRRRANAPSAQPLQASFRSDATPVQTQDFAGRKTAVVHELKIQQRGNLQEA